MSSKGITIFLFSFLAIIFIIYFSITYFILYPELDKKFLMIEELANQERWQEVVDIGQSIKSSWGKFKFLITLNYGEEDYATIIEAMDHIINGAKAEEKGTVLIYTDVARNLWRNATKVIPEP